MKRTSFTYAEVLNKIYRAVDEFVRENEFYGAVGELTYAVQSVINENLVDGKKYDRTKTNHILAMCQDALEERIPA